MSDMVTASYVDERARDWLAEALHVAALGCGIDLHDDCAVIAETLLAIPGVEASMYGVLDANMMNLKGMRVTVSSPVLPIVEADAPWLFTPPEPDHG